MAISVKGKRFEGKLHLYLDNLIYCLNVTIKMFADLGCIFFDWLSKLLYLSFCKLLCKDECKDRRHEA